MRLPLLALTPLLAVPAAAQAPVPLDYPVEFTSLPQPDDVARIVAGEFNGTSMVDVATLLDSGTLCVAFDPVLGEASASQTSAVYSDIAAYAPSGGVLDRSLFAVGSGGLQRLEWNMGSGAFEATDVFAQGSNESLAWQGATRLRSGDIDGDGLDDLVGVAANGQSLLAVTNISGVYVPLLAGSLPALVPGSVIDLTVVDGDGVGTGEVAIVSTAGLYWYDAAGTLLSDVPLTLSDAEIETVSLDGQAAQHVAVLIGVGSTMSLWVIEGNTHTIVQNLDVSSLDAARIQAGFYDGDAGTDLAITSRAGDQVSVLIQRPYGYGVSGADRRQVVISDPPSVTTMAPVAVEDLDNDGDADLAYPIADNGLIFMAKNDLVDHTSLAPRFLSTGTEPHLWVPGLVPGAAGPLDAYCRLEVAAPPPENGVFIDIPGATHFFPVGATHLEVRSWNGRSDGTGGYLTDPTPGESRSIPLASPGFVADFGEVVYYHELGVVFDRSADLHYLSARYVELDASGEVARSWPHSTLYFVKDGNRAELDYLVSLPFTSGAFDVDYIDPFSGGGGGTKVGGAGGTGCIPDYPPDDPPDEPPPVPADPPAGG